ncbi:MAG: hypothetical protein CBC93_05175 [Gammaproteobacteria bacterium TMED133]|nr:MAG: hypothetical protein CBC93_05175 [Gammaproteobacteria bacterium TMED133]
MNKTEISCWNCQFFAISWDRRFRYQCNKMGFKSNKLPSQEVKLIDNRDCLAFKEKKEMSKTRDRESKR